MDKKLIDVGEKWWIVANKKNDKARYKNIYKNLAFNIRNPILEIGGGSGSFLNYLDIKNALIIDAVGKNSLKQKGYKFLFADITKKLPRLNRKFKTIFLMEVLEHIKNPLYLMAQVYDLLEDKGICYISIPYTKLDPKREKQENKFNCHVCRWKKREIVDQINKVGFNVRVIQERRRFKNTAFWLPSCWLVLELKKRLNH